MSEEVLEGELLDRVVGVKRVIIDQPEALARLGHQGIVRLARTYGLRAEIKTNGDLHLAATRGTRSYTYRR